VDGRGPAPTAQRAEHHRAWADPLRRGVVLQARRHPERRGWTRDAAPARAGRGRHRCRGALPAGVRNALPRGHRRPRRVPLDDPGVQHVAGGRVLRDRAGPTHRQLGHPDQRCRACRRGTALRARRGVAVGRVLPVPQRHRHCRARRRPLLGGEPRGGHGVVAALRVRRDPLAGSQARHRHRGAGVRVRADAASRLALTGVLHGAADGGRSLRPLP
jgi:hypothetical protein